MAKSVLDRLNAAAKKRLKDLQAAAEQAAGGILEMSYRDTAEYALRGAAAVTNLMHEETRDIDKASKSVVAKARKKTKRTTSRKTPAKSPKRSAEKKNAEAATPTTKPKAKKPRRKAPARARS